MEDFHVGPYMTAVGDGELLTEVRVPLRPGGGSAHEKVERRAGDWAIAAASAAVWLDGGEIADAGIALSAVGLTTIHLTRAEELLRGKAPSEELSPKPARSPPPTALRARTVAGRSTTSAISQVSSRPAPCSARPPAPNPRRPEMHVSITVNGEQVSARSANRFAASAMLMTASCAVIPQVAATAAMNRCRRTGLLRGPVVGEPVGVEQQQVAGVEMEIDVGEVDVRQRAEQEAENADGVTVPSARRTSGWDGRRGISCRRCRAR